MKNYDYIPDEPRGDEWPSSSFDMGPADGEPEIEEENTEPTRENTVKGQAILRLPALNKMSTVMRLCGYEMLPGGKEAIARAEENERTTKYANFDDGGQGFSEWLARRGDSIETDAFSERLAQREDSEIK